MMKIIKKILRFFLKTLVVIFVFIVLLDIITSFVRYKIHYNMRNIEHPVLGSFHPDYSVELIDQNILPMEAYKGKVKLLYWHSDCPASLRWFPKLEEIAKTLPDSLEIFFITNQSIRSLGFFTEMDLSNFHICNGRNRTDEVRFKHSGSSHLVILDKHDTLRAYGYQLNIADSVIGSLVADNPIPDLLYSKLLFVQNDFQEQLKNFNNLSFQVSGYDESFEPSASYSINFIDFKNLTVQLIYSYAFHIPPYRVNYATDLNLNKEDSSKYCVYYKTKSPFAPMLWQMIFDDTEKRRSVFMADCQQKLDGEFGIKSTVIEKEINTLVLKDIEPTESNMYRKLSKSSNYQFDFTLNDDTTRFSYSLKVEMPSILGIIEQNLQMPVLCDNCDDSFYQVAFTLLNSKKFTKEEIMKDLEDQGFNFVQEKRYIDHLELTKAAENVL